jgi:predicted kinase
MSRPPLLSTVSARPGENDRVTSQLPPRAFIVVSGPPGSGKTTLAVALAPALNLPLIAKDTIKEALMSVLPVPDTDSSRALGRASMAALYAVAAQSDGAVLESVWHRSRSLPDLQRLVGNLVEVFCRCDARIAAQRYAARAGSRPPGHFDRLRTPRELWNDEVAQPVAGGWPVLEVATDTPVELAPLLLRIRAAAAAAARSEPEQPPR